MKLPETWSELLSFLILLMMLVSGLTWGLKLDFAIADLSREMVELKSKTSLGVLPRADERLRNLEGWRDRHDDED